MPEETLNPTASTLDDTPTETPTDTPTDTPTAPPTDTPTDTPTAPPTDTPTETPTALPTETPTAPSQEVSSRSEAAQSDAAMERPASLPGTPTPPPTAPRTETPTAPPTAPSQEVSSRPEAAQSDAIVERPASLPGTPTPPPNPASPESSAVFNPSLSSSNETSVAQPGPLPDTPGPSRPILAGKPLQPDENRPQPTPFQLESPPTPSPAPRRLPLKPPPAEASHSPFSITVGRVYDGPMDLLLDLIRKQNIDIYDIPIARITAQFLEYTHHLKQTDVDAAGEFIYMASLLIHIKSKLLLPRDTSDGNTPDSEDPRRELVERLLEHERFKAAAQMLLQKQQVEDATWSHPGMPGFLRDLASASAPANPETGLALEDQIAADTGDLVRVFSDMIARLRARPVLNVNEDQVTVAHMMEFMKRRMLMEEKPISLRRLLHSTHTERAVICAFLAMLELVRLQAVLLFQPATHGDILLKKSAAFDQIFEDDSTARDDWR